MRVDKADGFIDLDTRTTTRAHHDTGQAVGEQHLTGRDRQYENILQDGTSQL